MVKERPQGGSAAASARIMRRSQIFAASVQHRLRAAELKLSKLRAGPMWKPPVQDQQMVLRKNGRTLATVIMRFAAKFTGRESAI
jgi:hypothetical protein